MFPELLILLLSIFYRVGARSTVYSPFSNLFAFGTFLSSELSFSLVSAIGSTVEFLDSSIILWLL